MSLFYKSLGFKTNYAFKKRKQAFKKGKPCAICGNIYPSDEMMVAHKTPVRDIEDWEALNDESNWEVRCIECERKLTKQEDRERSRARRDS